MERRRKRERKRRKRRKRKRGVKEREVKGGRRERNSCENTGQENGGIKGRET
jgi:hypothetical protein